MGDVVGRAPCLAEFLMGRMDCRRCGERSDKLFSSIAVHAIDHRELDVHDYEVPAGTVLLRQGDAAAAIFTIRAGFVKRWLTLPDGTVRIVRLLRPGDVLGLEALSQRSYDLGAGAVTAVQLCRLPINAIDQLRVSQPNLIAELESRWRALISRTDHFVTSVNVGSSRARVLKLLCYLAEFVAPAPCPSISRQDMAAMLDVSPATASRVVAELKVTGVLRERRHRLEFEPARLERLLDEAAKTQERSRKKA
jgi:CRP-like cAMP-binding protein